MRWNLRLAAAQPAVRKVLDLSHLASVFESYESVDAARLAASPVAVVHLPRRIPVGMHGSWLAAGE